MAMATMPPIMGVMATTTPIDASRAARAAPWARGDTLLAVLILLVALMLLMLSARQLLTQLSRIPANSSYDRYQALFFDPEQGADYLRDAAARLNRIPPARRGEQEWRRLAAVLLMQPLPDDQPATLEARRAAIVEALMASLVRNPVQPLGWAYLADVRLPPLGECTSGMAALRQSYRVVPVEPDFLAYRLELAVRCPLEWDVPFLQALRTDLLSLYGATASIYARQRAFILWLRDRPQVEALVRRLLREQPDALARLDRDQHRFSR